jgi:ribonuclease P protein component
MTKRRMHLSRPDFTAVSNDRSAKRLTSPHFSITISKAGIGTAVVVSKKITKSSVGRHRLKRRVREAIAPFISNTQAFIVYARAGSAALPYSDIVTELTTLI